MINITKKQRYGVAAMLDIALHQAQHPVSVLAIAKRQGISPSYVEQILAKLKRAHLVQSMRGPGGGYRLALDGEDMTIERIVNALEAVSFKGESESEESELTAFLWEKLSTQTKHFLQNVTIAQVFENKKKAIHW